MNHHNKLALLPWKPSVWENNENEFLHLLNLFNSFSNICLPITFFTIFKSVSIIILLLATILFDKYQKSENVKC